MQYVKRFTRFFLSIFNLIINLYLPNIRKIMRKELFVSGDVLRNTRTSVYQRLKVTGKGLIKIGNSCSFGCILGGYYYKGQIELQARYVESIIEIGNRVSTNNNVFICCKEKISIGDDCLIGHNVEFIDFDGHPIPPLLRHSGDGLVDPIHIGKNVWFGNNVTILRGTQIGDNSIVAAGAVVKGKFASDVLIGGVPARVLKKIN